MLKISFATEKGGVGKSTTCLSLAGAYAKTGRTVHIIDLDTRRDISRWLSKNQPPLPNIAFSTCEPQQLGAHIQEVSDSRRPDFCFIDLPGLMEVALTIASYRADLTILPLKPSNEAEVFGAANVAQHIKTMCQKHGGVPFYRVLFTRVQPIVTMSHLHGKLQVHNLQLPELSTQLTQRTAYEEMSYSGRPPHFAPIRDTTAKAVEELDKLKAELDRLLGTKAKAVAKLGRLKAELDQLPGAEPAPHTTPQLGKSA